MNQLRSFEQINDIAESIGSMSGLVYKMLMEFHGHLQDKATIYDIEETMGPGMTMKAGKLSSIAIS